MAAANFSHLKVQSSLPLPVHRLHNHHHHSPSPQSFLFPTATHFCKTPLSSTLLPKPASLYSPHRSSFITFSGGGGGGDGSGGGGGGESGGDGDAGERNKNEAIMALAEAGRSLDSIPKDLAAAIQAGKIPGSIVRRFFELEKSPLLGWLLRFGGFKERLLADDLFLTKVAIECGVGIFTKTAAEYERRRENFTKELDFVFADVVMAIIADFMLVWLPAPTVSLRPPLAITAGGLNKFFYGCPDNAFQVALAGTSYSFLQRIGAIVRNGAKLFVVGTSASLVRQHFAYHRTSSFDKWHMRSSCDSLLFFERNSHNNLALPLFSVLISFTETTAFVHSLKSLCVVEIFILIEVGTGVTNALLSARKAIDKSFAGEAEDVPIIPTSVAYGVYMAVSSNLRYQILAGVIEQRILEPLLHEQKLILSALCFAVRTGNTFLGSLLWVDYARWVGVQKIRD
ncbi:hypothetical protein STAS_22293 [Striga asiatica]|uniref:Uncharacterized protein n=2 Tax=Magnoliopsida TaxID=3398 RepID=A0A5A7QKG4_STRAF|nr:hypothetical protein STAS_22293 [Striga asiatica]